MTLKNHAGTRAYTLLLIGLLAVSILQAHYYWHYVNDDAYITFRCSRNLAEGRGPYFNSGEHVEGYTSLLMMALMAVSIGGLGAASAPVVAKILGVLAAGGAVLLTFLLFRRLFGAVAGALSDRAVGAGAVAAAGMVAVSPAFAVNSTSGLETSLFSFLLILGVFLEVTGRERRGWLASALAFSLAGLTRPEGFVLFGVYWMARVMAGLAGAGLDQGPGGGRSLVRALMAEGPLRASVLTACVVVCVFVGQVVFRLIAYDGEWLPNTYYAKQGGFWAGSAREYMSGGLLPPIFGIAGLVVSVVGYWITRGCLLRSMVPLFSAAVAGACLPLVTGTDWMLGWRLVIPYLPLVAVLAAGGWVCLLERIPWPRRWVIAAVIVCCVGLLWVVQGGARRGFHDYIETRSRGYQTGHVALAEWLAREAKDGDAVALMDIGIVGYMCPRQSIIDITGLTDRFIAKSEGDFLHKTYDPMYILGRGPEFIVITLTAPGVAYRVAPAGTSFRAWTGIETSLAGHPEFVKAYVRQRPPADPGDWLDVLAGQMGAERIFEHAHPGVYYLLAVFRRLSV